MADQLVTVANKSHLAEQTQREFDQITLLEESLWKMAQRFQSLIENSSDIVVILDANGFFRYTSPSTSKILGYGSEDLVGNTIFEFTHPDDASEMADAIKEVVQLPGISLSESEHRLRHRDGSWRTFAATLTNFLDNPAVNGLLVNCHDVSARKQVEQTLDQVLNSISDHIYVTEVTEDGHHLNRYISLKAEELTGYPREKFLADQNFWPSTVIHPDDRAASLIQAARLDIGQDSEAEYRLVRADGKVVWVRDSGKVYAEGTSKIIYGVVSDITERKQLEAQYRQSQKMEAVGQLAGGIAHDFNNLLTVIIGNCEFVLDTLNPNDPLQPDIEQIQQMGYRAASLTRQLLAFSRKQVLHPEVLNPNTIISDMASMLRRLIGEDIELTTIPAANCGRVQVDPGQLEQVIMNLVVNARDAMPQGGKLTIETSEVDLDETYARQFPQVRPGAYVILAVSDTGHGMDEETKSRIFEPFFTTKERDQGTGLGLSTVHGIVNQSGGCIWLYSEPGKGTTFKIHLPRIEGTVESTSRDRVLTESAQGSETILLVEDEDMVRELAHRALNRNGYTVLAARHGAEALQVSEQYTGPINLLVTDIVMPGGMNGFQLAERLVSLRPEMRGLYMSGYTDQTIAQHGVLDQETAYLQKPFTLNSLIRKVRDRLDSPH